MAKTQMIGISNDFHAAASSARAKVLRDGRLYLSQGQVARIRRELCGLDGCTCGGELGERGRQGYEITPDYDTRLGGLRGAYLTARV